MPSIIVRPTLNMSGIILTAADLGFLGLGAQPPMAELGTMGAAGRKYATRAQLVEGTTPTSTTIFGNII